MEFLLLVTIINLSVYRFIRNPKKCFFGKGSLNVYLTYDIKKNGLKPFFKRIVVAVLRPIITDDKANVVSFYLFVNLSLILMFFEPNDYIKNVSYSIIGAVIFHYFVIMIPQEKQKISVAQRLLAPCRTIRDREKVLFELLGYQSPFLISDEKDRAEFVRRFVSAVNQNRPIGSLKCLNENVIETFLGSAHHVKIPAEWTFTQLLEFLNEQDKGSFKLISKLNNLSFFTTLLTALDDWRYQLGSLAYLYKGSSEFYVYYIMSRQKFLVAYHRSAMNYIYDHDEDYILPKL